MCPCVYVCVRMCVFCLFEVCVPQCVMSPGLILVPFQETVACLWTG